MSQMNRNEFGKQPIEELYKHHSKEVWALSYARSANAETARDVTQETFFRLLVHWKEVMVHPNPRAWLLRVAQNLTEDILKRSVNRRSRPLVGMENVATQSLTPDVEAAREELRQAVRDAVKTLPPDKQLLYQQHYVNGLTFQEISSIREISRSTINREEKELRAELRPHLEHLRPDIDPDYDPLA